MKGCGNLLTGTGRTVNCVEHLKWSRASCGTGWWDAGDGKSLRGSVSQASCFGRPLPWEGLSISGEGEKKDSEKTAVTRPCLESM